MARSIRAFTKNKEGYTYTEDVLNNLNVAMVHGFYLKVDFYLKLQEFYFYEHEENILKTFCFNMTNKSVFSLTERSQTLLCRFKKEENEDIAHIYWSGNIYGKKLIMDLINQARYLSNEQIEILFAQNKILLDKNIKNFNKYVTDEVRYVYHYDDSHITYKRMQKECVE